MTPSEEARSHYAARLVGSILGAITMSTGCILRAPDASKDDALLMREMTAGIYIYRDGHEGAFPTSIECMAQYLGRRKIDMPHGRSWTNLVYVANLVPSDPGQMPLFMSRPAKGTAGIVMTKDTQNIILFSSLNTNLLKKIYKEPWLLVEHMAPGTVLPADLKQRVSVQM